MLRVFHLLRPRGLCRLCALPCEAPLCGACATRYLGVAVPRCPRCARPLPRQGAPCGGCLLAPQAMRRCVTLANYAPPLDRLVASLKFGAEPALGRWLGDLLARTWRDAGLARPAMVVPVPLSDPRLRLRGYNQAWEIARGFARALHAPARTDLLRRLRDTEPQSSLPLARRARNLRGAFEASAAVRGRRVVLVDDVMTSGCTLDAAADALLRGGAAEVAVAVALRTPAPD